MKRGPEYVQSNDKRYLDKIVARLMYPASIAARLAVSRHLAVDGIELPVIFEQTRVGRGLKDFNIRKFTTTDQNGESLGEWADQYRRRGLDELGQLSCVLAGTMSIDGPRPILRDGNHFNSSGQLWTFERVMDEMDPGLHNRWSEVIRNSRPGIFSSYGLHEHCEPLIRGQEASIRAELDIRDYVDASPARSLSLIAATANIAIHSGAAIPDQFRYMPAAA